MIKVLIGFGDGSGWRGVYDILKKDGFNVSVVQNPTISLAGDVSATKLVIDSQPGPVMLVGHSTAGLSSPRRGLTRTSQDWCTSPPLPPPDKGKSVNTLIANPPPGAPVPPILPPKDGYLFLDKAKFAASFAGDVDPQTAAFMAESQVPWGVDALGGAVTEPAWKSKPSWYLQVRDDKMIPYPAQQFMAKRAGATVAEVPGSHAIYVSNPSAVAALIEQAAGLV